MAYNPYKTVKTISELKGKYHTAKELGKDPSQYQQEAVQYYNELRDNDYGDLADKLTKADYIGSRDILAGLTEPKPYDDWYDSITSKKIEEASKPVRSETVDQIMAAYNKNADLLSGQVSKDANGNYVSGAYADLYGQAAKQMDYIRDMDFTQKPWYENLMAQYQLGGQKAANGALSSGAAGNSGNIDSYAAANANRQQLAFTTAGTQAALDAYAQQLAAWQNAFGGAAGLLDSAAMRNNEALEIGAKYYDTDSLERQNALNKAAELEKERMQTYIDEFMHRIEGENEADRIAKDYDLAQKEYDLQIQQYRDKQAAAQAARQTTAQTVTQPVNAQQARETTTDIYDFLNSAYEMYQSGDGSVQSLDDIEAAAIAVYGDLYKDAIRTYMTRFQPRQ